MIIKIENGITRHPGWRMAEPVNIEILQGEQIAIAGDNAAGKSRLVEILSSHFPLLMNEVKYDFSPSPLKMVSENLKYITFRDSYGDKDGTYYYQQRWNQHDIDENTPTTGALLQEAYRQADESIGSGLSDEARETAQQQRTKLRNILTEIFHLEEMADKYIISLSSGELRKFQLAKTLGAGPRVIIMDNPFIGEFTTNNATNYFRELSYGVAGLWYNVAGAYDFSTDTNIKDLVTPANLLDAYLFETDPAPKANLIKSYTTLSTAQTCTVEDADPLILMAEAFGEDAEIKVSLNGKDITNTLAPVDGRGAKG